KSSSAAAARPAEGLRTDYDFVATMDREIMHDPEREVGYGITGSWDEIVETLQGAPVSTDTELGGYMREFETRVRQDTEEIYMRLDDEQTRNALRSTNGDDSHKSGTGVKRTERATHECTYIDFLKCEPLPFKGTEGVASLSQWC
nr:hypothetical protein [Tanacetum cinerariifolium]